MKKIVLAAALVLGVCTPAFVAAKDSPKVQKLIENNPNMISRITLAGTACVTGEKCAVPAVSASSVPGQAQSGEDVYNNVCSSCHGIGAMGSPKFGSLADWGPRIAKGKPTLYDHAIKGFNGKMPPKGGASQLSDDEVKGAVDYMTSQAK